MLKKLALWCAILFTSNAWANIDVLMVFTPSGAQEASQVTGVVDPGPILMDGVNDTFEISTLIRPFVLLDSYYLPEDLWVWKSVEILREAETDKKEWAKEVRYRREMLGADMVVIVWGDDDTPDPRDSAGWGREGSAYITVRGKYSYGRKTIEHEFGHAFGLRDSTADPFSVMYIGGAHARVGYTPSEVRILAPNAMKALQYRSRKENNCIQ